jgi:hypothetical protein
MCKKNKSNARKRSGDNENAILWTPLLTPFAQMDILGPKGLGFLLYGGRVERDLKGTLADSGGGPCRVSSRFSLPFRVERGA